ncbi:MAG: hypothetical protein LAO19_06775 [Acidobacteriia bacterium]|nr:hypothetical protein [Terriglobia bacterium]
MKKNPNVSVPIAKIADKTASSRDRLSRRGLLKKTAGALLGAAAVSITGALDARAQVQGLYTWDAPPAIPLPMGALTYLDRKQYIHNMEIISHLPGASVAGGEPLMAMWARGKQRALPGGGGFVDVSDAKNPVVIGKGGPRAGGAVVYNTKLKKWIAMATAAQPLTGAVPSYPHGQYDKDLRNKILAYDGLRGIRNFDVTDPTKPNLLQEYNTGVKGTGTHHNFYDGGQFAYLDGSWDDQIVMENHQRTSGNGLIIIDMSDPGNVKEVAKWWVPGMLKSENDIYRKYTFAGDHTSWTSAHGAPSSLKRVEDGGTVAYGGFGAFGMYAMDLSDIAHPKPYGHVQYEFNTFGTIPFHTCLPIISDAAHPQLANLLVCTNEALEADCRENFHPPSIVDVKDPRNPKIISLFPRPEAPPDAPYSDFCFARGRFGTHNTQCLVQPGAPKPNFVAMTWFNAGIRIYDISDPLHPKEVAWFVPPRDGDIDKYETWWRGTTETVFVEWDRNLIWVGTHEGTYCLSCPALGKPVTEPTKIERWSQPFYNLGWDDQTPRAFFFGRSLRQMG